MIDVFKIRLSEIQPSQLYISQTKLNNVMQSLQAGTFPQTPIPIKELDGELVSTDGHTRGVALLLSGHEYTDAEWEEENLDWEAYRICVQWCKDEGINSLQDLRERIVSHEDYEALWYDRCRVMHEDLERKRRDRSV